MVWLGWLQSALWSGWLPECQASEWVGVAAALGWTEQGPPISQPFSCQAGRSLGGQGRGARAERERQTDGHSSDGRNSQEGTLTHIATNRPKPIWTSRNRAAASDRVPPETKSQQSVALCWEQMTDSRSPHPCLVAPPPDLYFLILLGCLTACTGQLYSAVQPLAPSSEPGCSQCAGRGGAIALSDTPLTLTRPSPSRTPH